MATRQLSTEERDRELTEAATRLVTEHQHRPGAGWSGAELGMVPVERIRVLEGHNARQDLGDIFELTESIRSHGVLQALLVEQLADEGGEPVYGLLAGHRRLQAARMAQLPEVPCQVRRDLDAGTRTVVMLVENLRRRDLDPLEEAVGIRRLVELGLSQREVARQLGCSQGQVSKRLALLELPDQIRKTIGQPDDAGGITVADALELARLAEHPERRTRAFEQGRRGHYGGIAGMVRMELAEAEREARRAHARAELQRADVKILKEQDYYSWYSRREQPLLGCGHDHETLKLSVEQHQGEPCHAAAIDREGKVVYVCQDPSRHGDADPAASARAEKARREQEQHRLRREAGRGRREAMARVLAAANSSQLAWAARQILECWRVSESKLTCELLGLETPPSRRYGSPAYCETVAEHAGQSMAAAIRSLVALALASAEERVASQWGGTTDLTRRHLEVLVAAGYQPNDSDRKHLTGEAAADRQQDPPECRVCGCTEDEACEGGCHWVEDPEHEGDLCSRCLPDVEADAEEAADA